MPNNNLKIVFKTDNKSCKAINYKFQEITSIPSANFNIYGAYKIAFNCN